MSLSSTPNLAALGQNIILCRIIDFIRERIIKGGLRASGRLLPQRELAETSGSNRSGLLKTLRTLPIPNLIMMRRGSGAHAAFPDADSRARKQVFMAPEALPGRHDAHEAIVADIQSRNPDETDVAMRAHVDYLDRHFKFQMNRKRLKKA